MAKHGPIEYIYININNMNIDTNLVFIETPTFLGGMEDVKQSLIRSIDWPIR